jgi:hypothetical protein
MDYLTLGDKDYYVTIGDEVFVCDDKGKFTTGRPIADGVSPLNSAEAQTVKCEVTIDGHVFEGQITLDTSVGEIQPSPLDSTEKETQ